MFDDRTDAGRRLAEPLAALHGPDVVVLGVPRGGVPVAAEVARLLEWPLDVVVVRKLGVPYQPELAFGAVADGDVVLVDHDLVRYAGLAAHDVEPVETRERSALATRSATVRAAVSALDLTGRTAVVVDDGVATGMSLRAACTAARRRGAARVVAAAPVAPRRAGAATVGADELVCVERPVDLHAVGYSYRDFRPPSERDVVEQLRAARAEGSVDPAP